MEFNSEARRCQNCGAPAAFNAVHCGNCGKLLDPLQHQSPIHNQPPKQSKLSSVELTAIILISAIVVSCALIGIVAAFGNLSNPQQPVAIAITSTPTPTPSHIPQTSVTPPPQPIGNNEQRLAVAAEIRDYLRDQDIPAYVVASGTKLTISYQVGLIEYAPDTFFRQQGRSGMERMATAGFETLVIEAKDSGGHNQIKEFSLIEYRAH
jgi:hypothetical protein